MRKQLKLEELEEFRRIQNNLALGRSASYSHSKDTNAQSWRLIPESRICAGMKGKQKKNAAIPHGHVCHGVNAEAKALAGIRWAHENQVLVVCAPVSLAGKRMSNKDIILSIFDRIFLEKIIAFFRSGNFEAVRRASPGQLRNFLRSRTKAHC